MVLVVTSGRSPVLAIPANHNVVIQSDPQPVPVSAARVVFPDFSSSRSHHFSIDVERTPNRVEKLFRSLPLPHVATENALDDLHIPVLIEQEFRALFSLEMPIPRDSANDPKNQHRSCYPPHGI